MSSLPIPTTARTRMEYIPQPQDAVRFKREKTAEIDALRTRLDVLKRELRNQESRMNEGKPDSLKSSLPDTEAIRSIEAQIVEAVAAKDEGLAAIEAKYPTPMCFVLQVPTTVEREQINSRLITLGLRQVTNEQMRATMIEELFHHDWEKGSPEANEAHAEELANFLDSAWLRQETYDAAVARWQEQEVERLLDEGDGAPARPPAEMPIKLISVRETARMNLLVDEMMNASPRLRKLAADSQDFARQNSLLLVRAHILAATNVKASLERDPVINALPLGQALALREEMDDRSWADLVGTIDRMYVVDGHEEKNSDSPLEKPSGPSGSPALIASTESSDGSLTSSSSTPAQDVGSATIIDPLSASTSESIAAPAPETASASPTVEA